MTASSTPTVRASRSRAAISELTLENLLFRYGDQPVINTLSFTLVTGERLAIVGPNGCGKSSLLKLIVGHLRPHKGRIGIDGIPLQTFSRIAIARRIALVPQLASATASADAGLAGGGFTVRETVLMARYAAHAEEAGALGKLAAIGFETDADLAAANQALWTMDVHHLAPRSMDTLSGGERQRVLIARALAQDTPLLLLDEPTSALDLYHQLELLTHLETLSTTGRTLLIVTHDLHLAARCATRVVLMDQGKIVADGPPAQVLTPQVLEPGYRVKVSRAPDALHFDRAP